MPVHPARARRRPLRGKILAVGPAERLPETLPTRSPLPARCDLRLVKHSRFHDCEPRWDGCPTRESRRLRTSLRGRQSLPNSRRKVRTQKYFELLKGCLRTRRYHRCRKPSTYVSLRHIRLSVAASSTESGHGLARLAPTPPCWEPPANPRLAEPRPRPESSRPVHPPPSAADAAARCRHDRVTRECSAARAPPSQAADGYPTQ